MNNIMGGKKTAEKGANKGIRRMEGPSKQYLPKINKQGDVYSVG